MSNNKIFCIVSTLLFISIPVNAKPNIISDHQLIEPMQPINPYDLESDYDYKIYKKLVNHEDTHLLEDIIKPQTRDGKQVRTKFTYYQNNKAFNYGNALGHTEYLDYDLYRQNTRVTDPRGFVRQYHYDNETGALEKLIEPNGGILLFENTEDGLRYKKTDAIGYLTEYSYQSDRSISSQPSDNYGLVTRETDPKRNNTDYHYDIFDQIRYVRDKNGNDHVYEYY